MPKKGKGKKKGKGEKKAAGPPPPKVEEEKPLDELSKQFYLIQITDLEKRLARYQEQSDVLKVENEELQKQLKQQVEDQEQMITFLKKKSNEQAEAFVDLEEKLGVLQQAKNSEKERYEQQITQLKEDSQRALDQASVENKVLQGQLEALESFRINKEKLEAETKRKEELIEQLRREHEEALYDLEKKAVLDKDRMKKDMVSKVNSMAAEFRKVSDLQMAETTKRTIRENVAINSQLQKMSKTTTELIRENDQLKVELKNVKRQMEILEVNEKELNRRNISNQKVIRLMTDKAGEQRTEAVMLQEKASKFEELEAEACQSATTIRELERDVVLYRDELQSVKEELKTTQEKLATATKQLARMSSTLGKASLTIQTSLQPASPESEHPVQRENLLATLLDLLKFDSSKGISPQNSPITHKLKVPGYNPGDLGIVPAPKASNVLPPINNRASLTGVTKQTVVQ